MEIVAVDAMRQHRDIRELLVPCHALVSLLYDVKQPLAVSRRCHKHLPETLELRILIVACPACLALAKQTQHRCCLEHRPLLVQLADAIYGVPHDWDGKCFGQRAQDANELRVNDIERLLL
jgi:hypothetical protein